MGISKTLNIVCNVLSLPLRHRIILADVQPGHSSGESLAAATDVTARKAAVGSVDDGRVAVHNSS